VKRCGRGREGGEKRRRGEEEIDRLRARGVGKGKGKGREGRGQKTRQEEGRKGGERREGKEETRRDGCQVLSMVAISKFNEPGGHHTTKYMSFFAH
jgi:hypothetical protein